MLNMPFDYQHRDGAKMEEVSPFRYVRSESLDKTEKPQPQPHPAQSSDGCDCPIHATRNNKPA